MIILRNIWIFQLRTENENWTNMMFFNIIRLLKQLYIQTFYPIIDISEVYG